MLIPLITANHRYRTSRPLLASTGLSDALTRRWLLLARPHAVTGLLSQIWTDCMVITCPVLGGLNIFLGFVPMCHHQLFGRKNETIKHFALALLCKWFRLWQNFIFTFGSRVSSVSMCKDFFCLVCCRQSYNRRCGIE